MRRGRNKAKNNPNRKSPNGAPNQEEFRKSKTPIVVICHSNQTTKTNIFCSKTNQWQVIVHNPDTGKWWDRLQTSSRIRHGPPNGGSCHAIVLYDNQNDNDAMHKALKMLGESTRVATVALLKDNDDNEDPTTTLREELETVMSPENIAVISKDSVLSSYLELRQLWAFQIAHDDIAIDAQDTALSKLDQAVPRVCQEWSPLKWRWNQPKLKDLYQRLRHHSSGSSEQIECDDTMPVEQRHKLRRDFEDKAAWLLVQPETQQVADSVLSSTTRSTEDPHLFGRVHATALSSANAARNYGKYLIVNSNKKGTNETTVLNAYEYATSTNCTNTMDQLKVVEGQRPQDQFSIPLLHGNPMITATLIPALFPNGVQYEGTHGAISNQFDIVLGSRRIWQEHMALKACIVYLFQGQPGPLWDLAIQVVEGALPITWDALLQEPTDEEFLRSLFHPDVVDAGRLLRQLDNPDGSKTPLLPPGLDGLSRIYALSRFVRTLDDLGSIGKDRTVCQAVASTMKLRPEQVDAIIHSCKLGPLTPGVCEEILGTKPPKEGDAQQIANKSGMTQQAMEVLGMLGLFLNRDRKSLCDASRIDAYDDDCNLDGQTYATTKALADCAMYCGSIRWLSEDEDEWEGIWTCLPCLHRWQKRGAREAYQTRKLMHPMKMTPFTREEYYDPEEWDSIMASTNGNISRLGIDFYWGRCSTEGCGRVCEAVARAGACAETDGVPLDNFPETVVLDDGYETIRVQLRHSLEAMGPLGENDIVSSDCLEKYFDSEEKLLYLPGPIRRRVRNCIDKSTYILPRGLQCNPCSIVPTNAIDEYCPYCGTGFDPVFACVHYSCPQCNKHFCKACLGIDGIHFQGVYNATSHACWRILGNRYSYHNKGLCARCGKERPWPESHALVSAGPAIHRKALGAHRDGMPVEEAIQMQSANLKAFTERYREAVTIFENCTHTTGRGPDFCHCGAGVRADYEEE